MFVLRSFINLKMLQT